jgi:O-antigen/teichoic acid export membrane protein
MTISITNIAKNSLKFSTVQIIGAAISMLASMYIATIILPDEYGIYGFLGLWLTYAGLIGPGIMGAGGREMPGLLGKGEVAAAIRIQNVSLTPELVWSLVPFGIIIIASFFFTDFTYRVGLIIVAFSYLTGRVANAWGYYNFIREKFNTVAIGSLIQVIAVPLLTLLAVAWFKVYALLLAPLIVNFVLSLYYLKKGPINYYFYLNRKETFRLLKIGIVLQAGALVYWAYQLMDRTIIASMLSPEQLGLYTFAAGFVAVALAIPVSFTNVLQPILWRHAEKAENIIEGFKDAKRIAVYLALGTAMLVPLIQVAFYVVVNLITKNYTGSIPPFNVLSYNVSLAAIVVIPNLVLSSAIVNKQRTTLAVYAVGLVINIFFNILIIKLGYGIMGVAWVMVGSQCLVGLATFCFARRYLFTNNTEYLRFQVKILFPVAVSAGFYFLHRYLESSFGLRGFTGISLAAQAVVWAVVISVFYRDYLSVRGIKALVTQLTDGMRSSKSNPQ